ncbi:hypothetical protein [Aquimarina celericrescens]|uniref:Secreted protein n=1 Tax=Aquimarina celericrescens TaxID=1964542 RepID=A0ABW5B1C9_9FLAO|nr:hypothetical protein [Aquimarina celericrescens]
MKTKFLTLVTMLFLGYGVQAACTVTTSCGTFNFPNATSVSVSQSSSNGQTIAVIRDQNGRVLKRLRGECANNISTSCEGSGGDIDFCDAIPDSLKPYFPDCN